jgi:hypothetical protein
MASIERISRVSVYHLRTGAYAQTHVDEIYVYNGLQSVLFVPTVVNDVVYEEGPCVYYFSRLALAANDC